MDWNKWWIHLTNGTNGSIRWFGAVSASPRHCADTHMRCHFCCWPAGVSALLKTWLNKVFISNQQCKESLYVIVFPLITLSKKDTATRRRELLEVISPPLLEYLRDNAATMAMDKATSVTISDILASACGDLRPAMMAVAQLADQELVPGGTGGLVCSHTDFFFKYKQKLPVFILLSFPL